jgi:hypothetical protein
VLPCARCSASSRGWASRASSPLPGKMVSA